MAKSKETEFTNGEPRGGVWVGIDPSLTHFAVSVMDRDGRHVTRVFRSALTGVHRMIEIEEWLTAFLGEYGLRIMDVAVEAPVRQTFNALNAGMLHGMIQRVCFQQLDGCRPLVVPPTSLKAYVIEGKATTGKAVMMMSVLARWGEQIPEDNANDAYCLARFSMKSPGNTKQRQALEKIHGDGKHRQ